MLVVAAATPLGGDYAGDVRTMGNVLELTRDISDRFRRNDVRLGAVQRELVAIQLTEEPPASAGPSSLPTLHAQGERLLARRAQLKQEVTVSGERMNASKSTRSVLLQLDEGRMSAAERADRQQPGWRTSCVRRTRYSGGCATNESCAICLDDFEDGQSLSILACKHAFCAECIAQWLRKEVRCPCCRRDLSVSGA